MNGIQEYIFLFISLFSANIGIWLFISMRAAVRKRNKEIEQSWHAKDGALTRESLTRESASHGDQIFSDSGVAKLKKLMEQSSQGAIADGKVLLIATNLNIQEVVGMQHVLIMAFKNLGKHDLVKDLNSALLREYDVEFRLKEASEERAKLNMEKK